MEPTTMINLRVLSTAAVMALVLPMAVPTASFAQNPLGSKANNGAVGAGVRAGGGGGPRMGGGAPGGSFRQSGGGGGGAVHIGGGGGPQYSGGGGGVYRGGYGGGYRRHGGGGGGFIPGAVAGAVIGGAIASQGYYGQPGYYDDQSQYYDDSVAVAPEGGDDAAYCSQRFRSYDPASGTYLGSDGYRHPCP
jgi:hypothetical protein